jgi:hypothetical protein
VVQPKILAFQRKSKRRGGNLQGENFTRRALRINPLTVRDEKNKSGQLVGAHAATQHK